MNTTTLVIRNSSPKEKKIHNFFTRPVNLSNATETNSCGPMDSAIRSNNFPIKTFIDNRWIHNYGHYFKIYGLNFQTDGLLQTEVTSSVHVACPSVFIPFIYLYIYVKAATTGPCKGVNWLVLDQIIDDRYILNIY